MKRHLDSTFYRWGMAAIAAIAALAISTGGGGTVSSAASGPANATIAQAASNNSLPGSDRVEIDAQNRANAALLSAEGESATSSVNIGQGSDAPGGQAAPQAACPILPCFTDVTAAYPFYDFINRIYMQDLVTGYACGGPGEPCDAQNRAYYRPGANVTRGQMSKFIDNARRLAGIEISAGYAPIISIANINDGAGVVGRGMVGDSAGLAGYGAGTGVGRDIGTINSGVFAYTTGTDNSVGLVAVGSNDNGAWIGSYDAADGSYGLYIVHRMGGFIVGNSGDDPLNDSEINGDLVVGGNCTGCELVTLMQNAGTTDLHLGEVAAMTAAADGPSPKGSGPLVGADRAQSAYSTAVVGVVYYKWVPGDANALEGTRQNSGYYDRSATAIRPGEYFGVVTAGAYKEIKVNAEGGAIHVGDLLVASNTPGVAMKADSKEIVFGSVIGKAMGNLESGEGSIGVMITLK